MIDPGFFLVLETGFPAGDRRSGKRGVSGDSGKIGTSVMRGPYRIVSGLYPGQRRGGELFRRVLRRIAGAESALAVEERREKYFRKYFRTFVLSYFRKYYLLLPPSD